MSQTRFMFFWFWNFLIFLFLNRHFETATHCTLQPKYLMFFNIFTNKKHHFVKPKTNVPKRFVFFFSWCLWGWSWDFFFGWRLGFSFCISEWHSSLGPALPSCAGSCLAVFFALGVGPPFWSWPSFSGLGRSLVPGVGLVGLPSWAGFWPGSGLPSCTWGSASLSYLGFVFFHPVRAALLVRVLRLGIPSWAGCYLFFSRRRHLGGCQDQFQTKKGKQTSETRS